MALVDARTEVGGGGKGRLKRCGHGLLFFLCSRRVKRIPLARRIRMGMNPARTCRNRQASFVLNPGRWLLWSFAYGPPRQLERLPASFARHVSRGALSGDLREREDLVQPAQQGDRP